MNKIDSILKEALDKIKTAELDTIENVKVEYLGKKGKITEILKTISSLSIEEKKQIGSEINTVKNTLNEAIDSKKKEITNKLLEEKMKNEKIDIS
ncbi:MAG: phenylalanine--tRNA ligase subunit alpha, partial [Endomicrobiia bacterium]